MIDKTIEALPGRAGRWLRPRTSPEVRPAALHSARSASQALPERLRQYVILSEFCIQPDHHGVLPLCPARASARACSAAALPAVPRALAVRLTLQQLTVRQRGGIMRVYLHIGHPKTGSTTLQVFLYQNRSQLARLGYLYPVSLTLNLPQRLHNHNALTLHLAPCLPLLRSEITRAGLPRVILSAENFQWRMVSNAQLSQLRSFLTDLGASEIEIIIYLREQSSLCSSLCSQLILDGDSEHYEQRPVAECEWFALIADHRATLQRWETVFGREHLRVRLFEREAFYNGDLICDFLHSADIPWQADFTPAADTNSSLNLLQMELLRAMTRLIPGAAYAVDNPKFVILPYMRQLLNLDDPQLKYAPPRQFLERWREQFAEGNEWVRATFFPQRHELFSLKPLNNYQENYQSPAMRREYWDALGQVMLAMAQDYVKTQGEVQRLRAAQSPAAPGEDKA